VATTGRSGPDVLGATARRTSREHARGARRDARPARAGADGRGRGLLSLGSDSASVDRSRPSPAIARSRRGARDHLSGRKSARSFPDRGRACAADPRTRSAPVGPSGNRARRSSRDPGEAGPGDGGGRGRNDVALRVAPPVDPDRGKAPGADGPLEAVRSRALPALRLGQLPRRGHRAMPRCGRLRGVEELESTWPGWLGGPRGLVVRRSRRLCGSSPEDSLAKAECPLNAGHHGADRAEPFVRRIARAGASAQGHAGLRHLAGPHSPGAAPRARSAQRSSLLPQEDVAKSAWSRPGSSTRCARSGCQTLGEAPLLGARRADPGVTRAARCPRPGRLSL